MKKPTLKQIRQSLYDNFQYTLRMNSTTSYDVLAPNGIVIHHSDSLQGIFETVAYNLAGCPKV